jgi:hypothetical protein
MQTVDDWFATLETAIAPPSSTDHPKGDRPTATAVVTALLQAEKLAKQLRQQFPVASLMGEWQLHFSSTGKMKLGDKRLSGFYWPSWIPAQIGFQASDQALATGQPTGQLTSQPTAPIVISNQLTIGFIQLKLTGHAQHSPKKNLLRFDFTHMVVKIFGKTIYNDRFLGAKATPEFAAMAPEKLPFFAFFAINEQFIAARGRGGGLAIWVKHV